jgi:Tfp pilus assembly protein PilZ
VKTPENIRYPLQVSFDSLRSLPLDELEQVAQGNLFVATPQPPRVGTPVELVLTLENDAPVTLPAMIVWSRPSRPGTEAGFRAQLKAAPAGLPERLRDLAQRAYVAVSHKKAQPSGELVIEERVTSKEITSPMRNASRAATIPPPTRPPVVTTAVPDLALDLATREAKTSTLPPLPPIPGNAPTLRQRPPTAITPPVVVRFSSARNYLLHFEQFLENGLIYVAGNQGLEAGARARISVEVPDGEPPLEVVATVERAVQPPEVPDRGWVARFDDDDGAAAERFATASFIVSSPTKI